MTTILYDEKTKQFTMDGKPIIFPKEVMEEIFKSNGFLPTPETLKEEMLKKGI